MGENDGKIVGAEKAHKAAEQQIKDIDKTFEPSEKTLFERTHEKIEKLQREDKA